MGIFNFKCVPLHTAFHYHPLIVLVWLKYWWKRRKVASHPWPQGIKESPYFPFLQRLSVIFGFPCDCPRSLASCRDYRPRKMASCRDCLCDSASCWDSRQEAKSHGQSLQEAIFQAQQSQQEARDCGQSRGKPNMTDSLCRKWKLADSFIPCDHPYCTATQNCSIFRTVMVIILGIPIYCNFMAKSIPTSPFFTPSGCLFLHIT